MLKATTIGFVSIIALGVSLAAPSFAIAGHMGGGWSGGGGMSHVSYSGGRSGTMSGRADFSSGRFAQHDMGHDMGRMRMAEDHDRDRDRDRHDHDHLRFFPAFAFGLDTYSDVYDPDYSCFELRRIWTHAGWRLRRAWVCD
jgi:hypothetical protein